MHELTGHMGSSTPGASAWDSRFNDVGDGDGGCKFIGTPAAARWRDAYAVRGCVPVFTLCPCACAAARSAACKAY